MPDLEAALRGLQEELLACQRLALLGSMAAMVAHELNNLMTPILARAEAALTMNDPALTRKTIERTVTHAQRAIAVAGHLLDLAQGADGGPDTCNVAAVVQEALETATRPFEKDGIEVRVSVPAELHVRVRADLLCQVLLNLLLNARAAMKGLGAGALTISAAGEGEMVRIDVRDTGRGIPAEKLERVFNPFLAADPQARPHDWQQVGLGLAACRLIARRHGATIRALANPDRGCTFRLTWPVSQ